MVSQREIVDINYLLPNGKFEPHPAIIISNEELLQTEGFFYCVFMTTKSYNKEYTFELTNDMLTKPTNKKSFVKCQIVAGLTERDIIARHGAVKIKAFEAIKEKIIKSIF